METYIFQTILFQLVFLLVYELLLKKETFFQYNRTYLLLTPIVSLLLPLMEFESLEIVIGTESMILLPELNLSGAGFPLTEAQGHFFGSKEMWWGLYILGCLVSLLVGLLKMAKLRRLYRNPIAQEKREYRVIRLPNSSLAFTYFNNIFLGDRLKDEQRNQILLHELVHVRQKHSLDLMLFELLRLVLWFNPLIYIYQAKIAALHEFLADAEVVREVEKQNYYQQLLNTVFHTENISFINQFFNHSLIKKRIVMLQKSKSKSIAKSKFLLVLPLLLAMLVYVSCSEESPSEVEEPVLIEVVEKDSNFKAVNDVPFILLEEAPILPGCEGLDGKERNKCLTEKIAEFVEANFDTSLGKKHGLEGQNKVYVQFRISKDGEVEVLGVRGPIPELEEEARRVVSSLPDMVPGSHEGETVSVLYSLPIVFNAGD